MPFPDGPRRTGGSTRTAGPSRRVIAARLDGLRWGVGLLAALIGAMMLVAPHQFGSPVYSFLRPQLPIWGTAFLLTGVGLLGLIVLRPNRGVAFLLHLATGVEFLILAGGLESDGSMTGMSNFAILGVGTLVSPFLDSPKDRLDFDRRPSLLPIVVGFGSTLTGLTMLLMPAHYAGPLYDDIRGLLPWFCAAFLASGVILASVEISRAWRPHPPAVAWLAYVCAGGTLLAFFLTSSVPLRAWIGIAYYGGFGTALVAYPWLRGWASKIDTQSLQSRFAFVLGLAAGLPLIFVVALVESLTPGSQATGSTVGMDAQNLAFVVLLASVLLAILAGVFTARWLARPLESFARAANLLARGGEASTLPESQITEIASLSRTFSSMRDRLAARTAERERLLVELRWANDLSSAAAARATEQAKQTERRAAELNAVLDSMADGLVIYDRDGRVVRMNASAEAILGHPPSTQGERLAEPSGESLPIRADGSEFSFEELPISRALRGETARNVTVILRSKRRRLVWTSISAAPIRSADGVILGVVANLADVTTQRELERAREEILSLVSHDLRNPLTVLRGHAQLLQRRFRREGFSSELSQVEAILKSAGRMNSMIQELVESSRLEAGSDRLRHEATDLGALLDDVLRRVGVLEDRDRIRLDIPDPLPSVQTDPESVERLVVNLVTNALKYSESKTPVVVRAITTEAELVVSVADQGVGIPADEIPRLFEKYFRARSGQQSDGFGLGLYISRLLAEALGGRIWVESRVGNGSVFSFTLPR